MVLELLNIGKITLLALADSVNPCAIAVLAMILMAVLTQNPEKKHKVLLTGFAFVLSVFLSYLFYGLVIIQFFKSFAVFIRQDAFYFRAGVALFAMIIGSLNLKDFLFYKKGGFATEMPLFLRPKMKRTINKVTSPVGAFIMGFVLTLFLLPCTVGPYIVASGILAQLGTIGAIPWLVYYNLIFVLPLITITLLIYFGFTRIEDVEIWKERNVRKLHLITGIILLVVGIGMLAGWI